ncbi:3-phosphoserine/phosphohydroxythreonine transaminase [Bacteroidales bacterium]|nr:3-phosphoserine/phosphohydroxythreonine transaminase [Bacteroidales bacterium]
MKKHNFYAGPSILSEYTIDNTIKGIKNYDNCGLSVMEISHRSKEFTAILNQANELMRELLDVPEGYKTLWLHGGASMQFSMIPFNLMDQKAAYLHTGAWSAKAMKEATYFGEVVVVGSSAEDNFAYVPKKFEIPNDVDYFHFTSNNTIYGTQIRKDFDLGIPVISDMSSDILSRQIDISKYGLIYGGAQKNIGPSGVGFAIIKEDILGQVDRYIPTLLNYKTHIEKDSLYNTPPAVAIYACLQTLKWLKELGGVKAIEKINIEKANLIYDEIERNKMFKCTVHKEEDRSLMNVTFVMTDEYKDLEKEFFDFASAKGCVGIKGHRTVGGYRASIYNAMPKASIQVLVDAMKEFEKSH